MTSDFVPSGWTPADDERSDDITPPTETKGELTPPPRKPPTAVAADAAEPEPRPPRTVRRWDRPERRGMPGAVVRAVDAVLDVLDSIGDSIRTTADRLTR